MKKWIPSLFTLANLACGFIAICIGDPETASYLILLGMLFDLFDGAVARALDAQSEVGAELDSLADMVTFGAAPAYIYFLLAPKSDWYYLIPPIIFVCGSALRLAIFNTLPPSSEFKGLATPASAFFMVGIFLSYAQELHVLQLVMLDNLAYFVIPIFLSVMMLVKLPMFALKKLERSLAGNIYHLALLLVFAAALFLDPYSAPVVAVLGYVVLSVIRNILPSSSK